MRQPGIGAFVAAIGLLAAVAMGQGIDSAPPLISGWSLLQAGEGVGTIEAKASNPANPAADGKLLKIDVSKSAPMGKGRVGATQSATLPVEAGKWYDATFSAMTQTGTVGLVFSLETADGKVLARTTLPEIGRGRRGGRGARGGRGGRGGRRGGGPGGTTATLSASTSTTGTMTAAPAPEPPVAWPSYLVSLHARASDPAAHLTITPIEPTTIWLDNLKLVERKAN